MPRSAIALGVNGVQYQAGRLGVSQHCKEATTALVRSSPRYGGIEARQTRSCGSNDWKNSSGADTQAGVSATRSAYSSSVDGRAR